MLRFQQMRQRIATVYDASEANTLSEMAFEHVTGLKRADWVRQPDEYLSDVILTNLENVENRLLEREPIQYVLGEAWFYHRRFQVTPSVLIPRPETEELTERAIRFLQTMEEPTVLDVGTGSGCIAISLQLECPQARVTGADISPAALEIAEMNGRHWQAPVNWMPLNVLDTDASAALPFFDLIVSNPPYIPQREKADMEVHVAFHEPALALFVPDEQPLLFYEALAELAVEKLKPEGRLMVEIHSAFGLEVMKLFEWKGLQASLFRDLYGKDRIVEATRYR